MGEQGDNKTVIFPESGHFLEIRLLIWPHVCTGKASEEVYGSSQGP